MIFGLKLVTLLLVRIGKSFINGSDLSSALGYGCIAHLSQISHKSESRKRKYKCLSLMLKLVLETSSLPATFDMFIHVA